MLTEHLVIGKIEVLEDGQIQLREDTIIKRDDVEIHRTYHRRVLEPTEPENISDERDQRLKSIAGVVWTPEVIAEFRNKRIRASSDFFNSLESK